MKIVPKVRQKIYQLRKKMANKAIILMYHRVNELELDPWSLSVSPKNFAQQLKVIRDYTNPISLTELVRAHRNGNIPNKSVAVTFDDGYIDNFYQAKPLLEFYDIPATFFVTTGYIGQNREFWWDELDQLLLQPGKLPEKLSLEVNDNFYEWELGTAAIYTKQDYQNDHKQIAYEAKPGSRMFFYYLIWQQLREQLEQERRKVMEQLREWINLVPEIRPNYRVFSVEELSILGQSDLIEVGSHTVNHLSLSLLSNEVQCYEIYQSKADLENILQRKVTNFCYPYGDFTKETSQIVQKTGFESACTVNRDILWQESNNFALPRIEVQNWNKEEFAARLLKYFSIKTL
jgi:peptidoglycan/xylan/chitin deacetylase (PgdA/CDA1 family)